MADIDRVELLIGLSNNMRADNDEWRREVFQEGQQRAKRVQELMVMFEKEYGELSAERDRLGQYFPRRQEDMPKVVQQGPKP